MNMYVALPAAFGLLAIAGVLYGMNEKEKRAQAESKAYLYLSYADGLEQERDKLQEQYIAVQVERDDQAMKIAKLEGDVALYFQENKDYHARIVAVEQENVRLHEQLRKSVDHATQPLKPKRTSRKAGKDEHLAITDNQTKSA